LNLRKYRSLRFILLIHLSWIILLGFGMKYYSGLGHHWFNDYGAGLLYEVFWILFFFLLFPSRRNISFLPVCVFIGTSLLEILQLWHPVILEKIRSNFLGAALIGTTFVWWDFPHYMIGCFIGWLILKWIARNKELE